MKIREIIEQENCQGGVREYELHLDCDCEEAFIQRLDHFGDLAYYRHFPRPFFKMTRKGVYQLKGVQGLSSLRLILFREEAGMLDEIRDMIEGISC